jgi:hypothetical protein
MAVRLHSRPVQALVSQQDPLAHSGQLIDFPIELANPGVCYGCNGFLIELRPFRFCVSSGSYRFSLCRSLFTPILLLDEPVLPDIPDA